MKTKKNFYIIDGSAYIYRSYYAIASLTNSKGVPTNAAFGFTRMLLKVLKEEKPDYIAIAMDMKEKTFRHKEFKEYKANRPKMPEDLVLQLPYIKKIIEGFNICTLQLEGYEADDIIGTLVSKLGGQGIMFSILSSDKDLMQLIGQNVQMLDPMKKKIIGEKEVFEKFGVFPDKVTDVMGLIGDKSDNIPGVPGIGGKTAGLLMQEFGDLENLISNIDRIKKPSVKSKMIDNVEIARLSKRLVTIEKNVPIELLKENFISKDFDNKKLLDLFTDLEFNNIIHEMKIDKEVVSIEGDYKIITNLEELKILIERIKVTGEFFISTEITKSEPLRSDIIGVSIAVKEGEAYYIPFINTDGDLLRVDTIRLLREILTDGKFRVIGHDLKRDILAFLREGIKIKGVYFDSMIAAHLINPSLNSNTIQDIASYYLKCETLSLKEVLGKKKLLEELSVDEVINYTCKKADLIVRVTAKIGPLIEKYNMGELFNNIEIPLVEVLSEMEINGVKIDDVNLKKMSESLEHQMSNIENEIYDISGEIFNINSPKQLADILFNKLKLKGSKKTKTGYSTNIKVLEKLARVHPLPEKILSYRQLMKLKTTYLDALPRMVSSETGRIHSSYNQIGTLTGRFSSSNPNLQNIPAKGDIGMEIRKTFIAQSGNIIVSADYSQIELRILAHLSRDRRLMESFKMGEDVHERTAQEMFGVLPGTVTKDMRRMAKTINFGIIYGMSSFGLSEGLGISMKKAKEFIENYFHKYCGVKTYIERTIRYGRDRGFVTTLFNRRRYLPELKSADHKVREFTERVAVNTPIQGTAADMIKLAMINVYSKLKANELKTKMIMQVHDELVFEVPENEESIIKKIVKEEMEGVVSLSVPLIVDLSSGSNWGK